jgi:hypothetical protein
VAVRFRHGNKNDKIFAGGGNFVTLHRSTKNSCIMKKFFILLLAVAAVSFVGCSEDNGTDDDVRNDLLENSFWIYQESTSSVLWMEAVEFQKDGKCVYVYMERTGSSITDQGEAVGSYSYIPPIVTCNVSMDGETATMKLTVDGDKMTDERGCVFEKQ